jgi:hypothetical protein
MLSVCSALNFPVSGQLQVRSFGAWCVACDLICRLRGAGRGGAYTCGIFMLRD